MATGTRKAPAPKTIYNPITNSYYTVRTRSTVVGKKGTIIGKWLPPRSKKTSSKKK